MTIQLTIEELPLLLETVKSRALDLPFVSAFGCFNNNSASNIKRWGTRRYKEVLNTFSQQVPKTICPFDYVVGQRTKQLWIPLWKLRDFFITQDVFKEYTPLIRRVIELLTDRNQPIQMGGSFLYDLFRFLVKAVLNTVEDNQHAHQIQDGHLIIKDQFETKRFRNCDREYEIDGLGPMSSSLRNFVILLMNVDATDIDQKSSTPTIFSQFLDKAVLRAELDDRHDDVAELERGRIHLQNALKRKENGEAGVKEMLNATLYGCRQYLNDIDMNGIHTMLRTYVRTEGGFNTFGKPAKSWLSYQNMNVEHKLQRTFEKHLADMGIKTLSHIYDGCIVYGHPTEEQIKIAEKMTIEEVGVIMKWVIKKTWSKK